MISIIIATKNRPKQLAQCLRSIEVCRYDNLEIILSDQGDFYTTQKMLCKFPHIRIIHLKTPSGGKGAALNIGLTSAKGDIFAFTDDDCIVDAHWLSHIEQYLHNHPSIAGVFGKTVPYRPQLHKGLLCRTTFDSDKPFVTNNPYIIHYKELGIGNNMTFRRIVFKKIKGFKEWLGVGSVSQAGGIEGEFIYRALKNNFILAYEPSIKVEHNKWLTEEEEEILQTKYIVGTIAFYCYYIRLTRDIKLFRNVLDLHFHVTNKLRDMVEQLSDGVFPKQTITYLFLDFKSYYLGILLGVRQAGKEMASCACVKH